MTLLIFSTLLQDAGTRKPRWFKTESEVNIRVTDIRLPCHPHPLPPRLCVQNHSHLFQLGPGTENSPEPPAHSDPHVLTRDCSGHSLPFADHVQDMPFQVRNSPLVCMKIILFQWVHLPNKLHYSVLPLSIATIHQTCFIYTFRQWRVMLSSASLSKCQAELASPFPSFEGKGHRVYFFENAVSTYHVAETLL